VIGSAANRRPVASATAFATAAGTPTTGGSPTLGAERPMLGRHFEEPPAPILRVTMDWFLSAGVQPLRVSTCNSNAAMVRLAANGLGITVLPPILCNAELAAGLLRPIRVRPKFPLVTMAAVFVADDDGPAVRAGIAAIRQVVTATKYLKPLRDTSQSSRQVRE